ncbi:aldose epimerase family protein [Spongiimicrobium sp. 3-5]|uniref:aldose epimerase family protein n=1 Tax=Spongiimicrobium sp. 3-5 TaxID=3332596 RepID=UPI0039806A1F
MNQITIKNNFISLTVLDYGAIIQKLTVKDQTGTAINVVEGFDDPTKYLQDTFFLGACVGRYAGRISDSGFSLDGINYPLSSEKGCHLHGGKEGFGKKYWVVEEENHGEKPFVRLSYLSNDMEEGYPGNLKVTVTYTLEDNALVILHAATTDKTTVLNLTNHSYFKLDNTDTIDAYSLQLNCSNRLETNKNLVPTGNIVCVKDSIYDFLSEKKIGDTRLDTPYVINDKDKEVVKVSSKSSGISMTVSTNQPAVVVYTPLAFPAICFETQNYPDAPNHPSFPSSVLRPGESYCNKSIFKFGFVN